jgi:hypothetical protein
MANGSRRRHPLARDARAASLADGPLVNWQQKAIEDAREAHRKAAGDDANLNGLFWVARPD